MVGFSVELFAVGRRVALLRSETASLQDWRELWSRFADVIPQAPSDVGLEATRHQVAYDDA